MRTNFATKLFGKLLAQIIGQPIKELIGRASIRSLSFNLPACLEQMYGTNAIYPI